MTTRGAVRPLDDLRASLQAQFEAILVETARTAAARCAIACVSHIEENGGQAFPISMPDAAASAGRLVDTATECLRGPADFRTTGSKESVEVRTMASKEIRTTMTDRLSKLDPEEILRKVSIIRDVLAKIETPYPTPVPTPMSFRSNKSMPGGPQEPSTTNILAILSRVRNDENYRMNSARRDSTTSNFSRWKSTVDISIETQQSPDTSVVLRESTQTTQVSHIEDSTPVFVTLPPKRSSPSSAQAPSLQTEVASPPKSISPTMTSPTGGRSLEAAKLYAQRNAELGRYLAEITADLQRACILSSTKPSNRSVSLSPLREREDGLKLADSTMAARQAGFSSPLARPFPASPIRN